MATYFLDLENGSDAADGTTFANRWKTVTSGATAARIAPGDIIRVMASKDPSSLGISATWTTLSSTVTLASALNTLITDCETAWTASTNVTCSKDTTYWRTGTGSALSNIAPGFTTGKVSYFGLGSAQDYSAYEGITLWVNCRTSALAASTLSIRLCSDTTGDTTVDTLALPAIGIVDCWTPVYIDKGSALGSSIQSIALYADADPGTILVYLDNINTVKAASGGDNLHLRSLIGKNTTGELWWGLREINGTTLTIDGSPYNDFGSNYRTGRGYWGTTESVTTYHRDPIVIPQTTGTVCTVQDSGTSGSNITFSGGWNRTDMSTQTGETWVDGSGAKGFWWAMNNQQYIHVDAIHPVRYDYGYYLQYGTGGGSFGKVRTGHCRTAGIAPRSGSLTACDEMTMYGCIASIGASLGMSGWYCTEMNAISSGLSGGIQDGIDWFNQEYGAITTLNIANPPWVGLSSSGNVVATHLTIGTLNIYDTGQGAFVPQGTWENIDIGALNATRPAGSTHISLSVYTGRIRIGTLTVPGVGAATCLSASAAHGAHSTIYNLVTSGSTYGVSIGAGNGLCEILKSSISNATPLSVGGTAYYATRGRVTFRNFNGTSGDHRSYIGGARATLLSETSVRHTASGLAWKLSPTSSTVLQRVPVSFVLADINVKASALVTVRLWMRRTHSNLVGSLVCRGNQIEGVASDVTANISAVADTWQEVEITFTPTVAGSVEIEVRAYTTDGVTTYSLYVDDITVIQA